jgi:hypothetical protein
MNAEERHKMLQDSGKENAALRAELKRRGSDGNDAT